MLIVGQCLLAIVEFPVINWLGKPRLKLNR